VITSIFAHRHDILPQISNGKLEIKKERPMSTIQCPHCGHVNASLRKTCDNCYQQLRPSGEEGLATSHADDLQQENPLLRGIADFLLYSTNYPSSPQIDLNGFLTDLDKIKPDLTDLKIPERLLSPKLPEVELPTITLDAPAFPDIDLSIILSYFANLQAPQLDYSRALEFLQTLQLPQIDLHTLGELLPHVDLSTLDLPALANLLPHIDLTTVDLPSLADLLTNMDIQAIDPSIFGELLSNIDLTAIDLSTFADILAGIDWSVVAEGLSEIDLSALLELLDGIDL
jgi:hypothetical protein